jgi:large subunit ribosomal protein L5
MSTLRDKYRQDVAPKLQESMGVQSRLRVPRVLKIVVNMGMGVVDKDVAKKHVDELALVTGQRPALTRARKSISNFKLREGMQIGARVTLRGVRMYEFLDRLINAALPRIRDFRGLQPRGFDGHGNYTLGLREQTIFPEIDPNAVGAAQGMDVTIVTNTGSDDEARQLLKLMGMPFTGN